MLLMVGSRASFWALNDILRDLSRYQLSRQITPSFGCDLFAS